MRDSSLEDFLAGDDRETDADSDSGTDGTDDSDSVSPAVSTHDWTPTGASCASCGAVVERRWRDRIDTDGGSGELVCADCKAW